MNFFYFHFHIESVSVELQIVDQAQPHVHMLMIVGNLRNNFSNFLYMTGVLITINLAILKYRTVFKLNIALKIKVKNYASS